MDETPYIIRFAVVLGFIGTITAVVLHLTTGFHIPSNIPEPPFKGSCLVGKVRGHILDDSQMFDGVVCILPDGTRSLNYK